MKKSAFTPEILVECIKPIVAASALWQGQTVHVAVIANPAAGGFTRRKIGAKNLAMLETARNAAAQKPALSTVAEVSLYKTDFAGHAAKYAAFILDTIRDDPTQQFLVVTAGGDGTHLEVQTAWIKAALASEADRALLRNNAVLLRLPFGTGNDGSDGRTLDDTLCRLSEPSHRALQRAIKVYYEGRIPKGKKVRRKVDKYDSLDANPPWYAFNIASIGIDAFITYMTNKTKRFMPGDTYQLWVDLACVFYNIPFPAKPLVVQVFDKDDNVLKEISSAVEFCLLGVSGHRTYGSNHLILPTADTFCIAKKMSLVYKLIHKSEFNDGSHLNDTKYCEFAPATKLRIQYDQDILVQMDGEVHLVSPGCYPLVMEHTEPLIPVLERDDATEYKGMERI